MLHSHISKKSRRTYDAGLHQFKTFVGKTFFLQKKDLNQSCFLSVIRFRAIWHYLQCECISPALRIFVWNADWIMSNPRIPLCVVRGYKRLLPTKFDKRSLITLSTMRHMHRKIMYSLLSARDQSLCWFAFCVAFFGYSRVGEFTSPTVTFFDETTLLFSDIRQNIGNIQISLRISKTDQFRKGYLINLSATNRSVCLVYAWKEHRNFRRTFPENYPVFVMEDSSLLTRKTFSQGLQRCLRGFPNASSFGPHSCRIGAATVATGLNHPDSTIQRAGF